MDYVVHVGLKLSLLVALFATPAVRRSWVRITVNGCSVMIA
jgi:hypothetical protein